MPPLTSVESAARINLRWIVRLRWGAVAGQVITILIAREFVRKPLPLVPLLSVCAALALANLAVQIWLDRGGRPTDRACALNLLADIGISTGVISIGGHVWQDRRRNPDRGRDHFGLLKAVDRRPVRSAFQRAPEHRA